MKHFTALVAFLFCALGISAQIAPEFEFTPDTVWAFPVADTADYPADLDIHSLVSTDITIRWQRNVLFLSPGCATKVCDLVACYPENFSTREFTLPAGYEGLISVHLVNPTGNLASAGVRLDMWNVDNPGVVVPSYYMFNVNPASGTSEAFRVEEIKVFPNPTADYFRVDDERVATIRMMSVDGREVARFNAVGERTFNIAQHAGGMYTLVMENEKGAVIGMAQIQKR